MIFRGAERRPVRTFGAAGSTGRLDDARNERNLWHGDPPLSLLSTADRLVWRRHLVPVRAAPTGDVALLVRNFALFLGTLFIAYLAASLIGAVVMIVFNTIGFNPVARLAIAIVGNNGPKAASLYDSLFGIVVFVLFILLTWKIYPRMVARWGSKKVASSDVGPIQWPNAASVGAVSSGDHLSSDPEPAVPDVPPDPR